MQYDCIVAGAGPAGCVSARELSRAGFSVLLLEEHDTIGEPVHCTGIIGEKLHEIQDVPEECKIKSIDNVNVYFPAGETLALPTPIRPMLINRALFDKYLFDQAREKGTHTIVNAKVENVAWNGNSVKVTYRKDNNTETAEAGICIVATGALSGLPARLGFSGVEQKYYSAQTEIEIECVNGIELYPGGEYASGSFAYIVSISGNTAKAGLIVKGNIREKFDCFLNSPMLAGRITKILHPPVFRLMPLGLPAKTVSNGIMTVGDAACQLKSTTGGGVLYGIKCARILAEVVKNAKTVHGFDYSKLRNYEKNWRKELSFEIGAGILLRKYLEKQNDSWWSRVYHALKTEEAVKLVSSYRDFDNHRTFIADFFRNPGVLRLLMEFADIGFSGRRKSGI